MTAKIFEFPKAEKAPEPKKEKVLYRVPEDWPLEKPWDGPWPIPAGDLVRLTRLTNTEDY